MRKNPNFDILVSVWFMTAASERREKRHEERQKQRRIWYAWCSICETFCCSCCRDSTAIGTNFARVYVFASCFSINRYEFKISCSWHELDEEIWTQIMGFEYSYLRIEFFVRWWKIITLKKVLWIELFHACVYMLVNPNLKNRIVTSKFSIAFFTNKRL